MSELSSQLHRSIPGSCSHTPSPSPFSLLSSPLSLCLIFNLLSHETHVGIPITFLLISYPRRFLFHSSSPHLSPVPAFHAAPVSSPFWSLVPLTPLLFILDSSPTHPVLRSHRYVYFMVPFRISSLMLFLGSSHFHYYINVSTPSNLPTASRRQHTPLPFPHAFPHARPHSHWRAGNISSDAGLDRCVTPGPRNTPVEVG